MSQPIQVNFQRSGHWLCVIATTVHLRRRGIPAYLQDITSLEHDAVTVERHKPEYRGRLLNNDIKTPYSDQFSLGMSNQLGDWLADVTVHADPEPRRSCFRAWIPVPEWQPL